MPAATKDSLIVCLSELINYRSSAENNIAKNQLMEYLATQLSEYDLHIKTHRSGGMQSIVATSQNGLNPKLLLQAHLDVIPAGDELFNLKQESNKLYGRGVYDMKFAAACYLELLNELRNELKNLDLGIMLTVDEEIGGEDGVGFLLDQGYSAEVCILPDGGDDWSLESECNGVWIVEIAVSGESAHGSRPWEGDNAIIKLLDVLNDCRKHFPMNENDKDTVTVSQISGGKAINQVPDEARVTLDMRFTSQEAYTEKRIEIEKIIQKSGAEIQTIARVEGVKVDLSNQYVANFMRLAEQIRGKPVECGRSYGASDAHYFAHKGIPTILIRPQGGGAHSDHEWIDSNGLYEFYQVLKEYVLQTAKIS
jgi:succinyl-diaminopimelate desuccinylase